jgi:hypothetical protein
VGDVTTRPLTERQRMALSLFAFGHLSHRSSASMPSLERRGLVRSWRDWSSGCAGYKCWEITDAGRAEAAKIQAEDRAKRKTTP